MKASVFTQYLNILKIGNNSSVIILLFSPIFSHFFIVLPLFYILLKFQNYNKTFLQINIFYKKIVILLTSVLIVTTIGDIFLYYDMPIGYLINIIILIIILFKLVFINASMTECDKQY